LKDTMVTSDKPPDNCWKQTWKKRCVLL